VFVGDQREEIIKYSTLYWKCYRGAASVNLWVRVVLFLWEQERDLWVQEF